MVDCAEGTVRQFEKQPYRPGQQRLRIGQVSKIFITHMHGKSGLTNPHELVLTLE